MKKTLIDIGINILVMLVKSLLIPFLNSKLSAENKLVISNVLDDIANTVDFVFVPKEQDENGVIDIGINILVTLVKSLLIPFLNSKLSAENKLVISNVLDDIANTVDFVFVPKEQDENGGENG